MAARKTRKVSNNSNDNPDCFQGDKLKKRKELFIQQFEKEAQERVNEMDAKLDKLLATLDRAFKIEMMKLPQSLHTTLIKDLMTARETSLGEVTMAIASASPEISKPLSRKASKRGKASSTTKEPLGGLSKTEDVSRKQTKMKMHHSNSTGTLRSTIRPKRSLLPQQTKHVCWILPGVMNRSLGDSLSRIATATITTSHGETLLLSEETKDEIRVELLDDVALCQMQKVKELMEYLSIKARMNNTQ